MLLVRFDAPAVLPFIGALGVHALLLGVVAAAAVLVAVRAGATTALGLTTAALLGIAGTGYAAFWAYLASPVIGTAWSGLVTLGSAAALTVLAIRSTPAERAVALKLGWPALACLSLALFSLAAGYMYGGTEHPLRTPAARYSHVLPADNEIPIAFAAALASSHRPIPSPLFGDWLSSDRPPLQTGVVLVQYPFFAFGRDLDYEVLAVLLQSLFVAGAWAFAMEARVSSPALAAGLAVAALNGFIVLNTFFVWPKLFPAAYALLIAAALLTGRGPAITRSAGGGAVIGLLAGAAMLGHEANSFALVGLGGAALVGSGWPRRSFLASGAICFAIALLPWLAYQHLYDPPGDRLLKWHLGGQQALNQTGVWQTISNGYAKAGVAGAVRNKAANFAMLAGDPVTEARQLAALTRDLLRRPTDLPRLRADAANLRFSMFFAFFPGIGVATFGWCAPAWLLLRRMAWSSPLRSLGLAWTATAIGIVAWCLLLFGPGTTSPHVGSYLFQLLLLETSAWAFFAIAGSLGWVTTAIQVAAGVVLYVVLSPDPAVVLGDPVTGLNSAAAVVALVALAAFFAAIRSSGRSMPPAR